MADPINFAVSTPVKTDDNSKKRDRSSQSLSTSINNPEKKNKHDSDSVENISDIVTSSPVTSSPVHLAESDFDRLSTMLKCSLKAEVEPLVKSIVTEVTSSLTKQITDLEQVNKDLRAEVKLLTGRVNKLETSIDTAEQYSRRNCLRIVGVPESTIESTDDIVMSIAAETSSDISISDIDRSHRLSQPSDWTSPRSIIVKFATYRARNNFYKARGNLKDNAKYKRVYVNEDLTSHRSKLLKSARGLFRDKLIQNCWSFDGRVFVKDFSDTRHLISNPRDLEKFKL